MTQDALDRGLELALTPIRDLPPLAWQYARHLCSKIGGCGEVFITAYAHYAQCVEGLPCADAAYRASVLDQEWFDDRLKPDAVRENADTPSPPRTGDA